MTTEPVKKSCFIVMPISDIDGYEPGHFRRVYEHLIKPACHAAGLEPKRADDVESTNYIVADLLRRVLDSDLVICDLSARNANVMYELGVRHAFDKPSVLVKDSRTTRVFDIQGLRTIDYNESLRVDTVSSDVASLTRALIATLNAGDDDVNSMIRLVNLPKAQLKESHVSNDTALVLNAIKDISARVGRIEDSAKTETPVTFRAGRGKSNALRRLVASETSRVRLPNGEVAEFGEQLFTKGGEPIGQLVDFSEPSEYLVTNGSHLTVLNAEDPRWKDMTTNPF